MSRCEFTPQARSELQQIHDYIAQNSPVNALRLVNRIDSLCYSLTEQPYMGIARPEFGRPDLRSFAVRNTPYIIFYYPRDYGVEIAHIRHGSQDLTNLFEQ